MSLPPLHLPKQRTIPRQCGNGLCTLLQLSRIKATSSWHNQKRIPELLELQRFCFTNNVFRGAMFGLFFCLTALSVGFCKTSSSSEEEIVSGVTDPIVAYPNETLDHARAKRQSLYLCGSYPYQYYCTTPCYPQNTCSNGGKRIGVGCTNSVQCTPYSTQPVQCIAGCCCTASTQPQPSPFGTCYTGQQSQVQCSARGQCASGQTCMNGLCCSTTGNEYTAACGGLAATGSCSNNACPSGGVCTPSNYCCECQWGRSAGRCNNGACPAGYSCNAGFCCASCPNNAIPLGECRNGQCGGGRTCRAGNICC